MKVCRVLCLALFSFALTPLYADDARDAELVTISAHAWMRTAYETIGGSRADAHGLAVDTPQGVVLIDTCWTDALENLVIKFPDSLIVVPGHGARGGPELLTRTLQLVPAG